MTKPSTPFHRFDLQLKDVLLVAWFHRWLIGLTTAGVLAVTLTITALQTPKYTATAVIEAVPHIAQELKGARVTATRPSNNLYVIQQFYRTEVQKITSRSLLETVVQRYQTLGYTDLPEPGAAAALRGMLTVAPRDNSQLMDISVKHHDATQAAVLANLVSQSYLDRNIERRQQAAESARLWLSDQLEEFALKIKAASDQLLAFKRKNNLADTADNLSALTAQIKEVNTTFAEVSTERMIQETKVRDYRNLIEKGQHQTLINQVDSQVLKQLTELHAQAVAEHVAISATYGPKHQRFLESKSRLDRMSARIEAELEVVLRAEQARLALLQGQEARLTQQIGTMQQALLDKQGLLDDHDAIESKLREHRQFYQTLSRRYDELTLAARTQLNNAWMIDQAVPPEGASSPNWGLNGMVALAVGLVLGSFLAFAREYFDDTISSAFDTEVFLKVPMLGKVPRLDQVFSRRKSALYTAYHPQSGAAEAMRGVRTLIESRLDNDGLLMVTSAVSGEGKTTTCCRLAVAYAQLGRRVLVVDADLRRSQLHNVFDCLNNLGLSSLLSGQIDPLQAVIASEIPNIDVVPAGPRTEHPSEQLAGQALVDALRAWQSHYAMIIIDTPPAIAVSDALVLSKVVNQVVLVVRAHTHSRRIAQECVAKLHQVDAQILGVVLNAMRAERGTSYYGYAYGDYGANPDADG